MTLSFTTHWRDELPDFYTSLSPTPLDNARLIWRNAPLAQQLGVPDALFAPESGAGVWGGEALLPGMSPIRTLPITLSTARRRCWRNWSISSGIKAMSSSRRPDNSPDARYAPSASPPL